MSNISINIHNSLYAFIYARSIYTAAGLGSCKFPVNVENQLQDLKGIYQVQKWQLLVPVKDNFRWPEANFGGPEKSYNSISDYHVWIFHFFIKAGGHSGTVGDKVGGEEVKLIAMASGPGITACWFLKCALFYREKDKREKLRGQEKCGDFDPYQIPV